MILQREVVKEIEYHFYNNQRERLNLEEKIKDIVESSVCLIDDSGVKGSGVGDPTQTKAAKLEQDTAVLKQWLDVVQKTYDRFKGTPYAELMAMVFIERLSPIKIQDALYISERTYYDWKSDIIQYAAMKACELRLIHI